MIFASFFIFDSTVSQKMDHFDILFACSIFSKSWEVTNYGFLGAAHLPVSPQSWLRDKTKSLVNNVANGPQEAHLSLGVQQDH